MERPLVRPLLLTVLLNAFAMSLYPAHAVDKSFEPGRDLTWDSGFAFEEDESKKWKEDKIKLWAYPADEDLRKLPEYGASGRLTQFLDVKTLTVGKDEVVRYTVVLESPTGVRNVSFEGTRCFGGEYKVYGYGTRDKTVRPLSKPKWRRFDESRNRFRRLLAENLICDGYGRPKSRERILELLERGDGIDDDYERLYGI